MEKRTPRYEKKKVITFENDSVDIAIDSFTNEQLGEFFRACYFYDRYGEEPASLSDKFVYALYRANKKELDYKLEKYKARCEKAKNASAKRWGKENNPPTESNARKSLDEQLTEQIQQLEADIAELYEQNTYDIDEEFACDVIIYYLMCYASYFGTTHPKITMASLDSMIIPKLSGCDDDDNGGEIFQLYGDDNDLDMYKDIIKKHFKTSYEEGCDYSIYHFLSGKIRTLRYREWLREPVYYDDEEEYIN